jgi:hypothetical protein
MPRKSDGKSGGSRPVVTGRYPTTSDDLHYQRCFLLWLQGMLPLDYTSIQQHISGSIGVVLGFFIIYIIFEFLCKPTLDSYIELK